MPPPVGSAALAIDAAPLVLQPRAAGTRRFARDWLRWRRLDLAADRAVRSPRARVPMPEPKSGAGRRKPRRAGIAPTEGPPETLSIWPVPAPSDARDQSCRSGPIRCSDVPRWRSRRAFSGSRGRSRRYGSANAPSTRSTRCRARACSESQSVNRFIRMTRLWLPLEALRDFLQLPALDRLAALDPLVELVEGSKS